MALELRDCTFYGPALPESFVKFQLERELNKRNLLGRTTGPEGRALEERWEVFRRKLRQLGEQGGDRRVANHVLEPLVERLGYSGLERQAAVITREGAEDGGWLFSTPDGNKLRAWAVSLGTDLDAPNRRGRAYRFSPSRVAQRVLLASGERMGLLTDGEELRILLCDPARPDSHIRIDLDRAGGWRAARGLPDSYRLLLALASPAGVAALPDLTDAARLAQSSVTKKLRLQARRAIEGFLQEVLDHPANAHALAKKSDRQLLAQQLWSEGLITVYRLLFVFKLEITDNPARAFSFKDTSLWRNTYSPNTALADVVRLVLDEGKESGSFLERGLRTLWLLFEKGMSSSELEIKPLGGMLFGRDATPLLGQLQWGEQAVARLLDALLWTPGEGVTMRERVHYGALDVEDLGRVYESLLELEPGISSEPMCRLRRAKLEVVVPVAQGDAYRSNPAQTSDPEETGEDEDEGDEDEPAPTRGRAASGSKTKVEFIEEIAADRFFLRVGLGRKASGSYYTPHPFVRFLVQETLGVLLAECSPRDNPQPLLILKLKVLDAAMGSGHFLVEACRFLGEGLYEACRLCDELAVQAEEQAEKTEGAERETLFAKAAELRKRVEDLPDPNNELLAYLPSRAAEGEESGLSQKKAEAMCRRLVAVHCLYGVDKNPLAVELAKLSLWLESYAEGLPLTFLDHRLILGDSITGPSIEDLFYYPKANTGIDDLFTSDLSHEIQRKIAQVLSQVVLLEATIGMDVADLRQKEVAKIHCDKALRDLRVLCSAWSGGRMLGDDADDQAYKELVEHIVHNKDIQELVKTSRPLSRMAAAGKDSICFQLVFPEIFDTNGARLPGFDAVVGNPPWDKPHAELQHLVGSFNLSLLEIRNSVEMRVAASSLFSESPIASAEWTRVERQSEQLRRVVTSHVRRAERLTSTRIGASHVDLYMAFVASAIALLRDGGKLGMLLSGGFAKNPAALPLRKLCIVCNQANYLYQFDNSNHLFADLPSILEFCLVVATKGDRQMAPYQVATSLSRFEDLSNSESIHEGAAGSIEKDGLLTFASLASEPAERADNSVPSLWRFSVDETSHLLQEVYPSRAPIKLLSSVLPGVSDPRSHQCLQILLSQGLVPVLEGRSIAQYSGVRVGTHARWNPVPTQLLEIQGGEELCNRVRHYRLCIRRKVGSPKSNERSLVCAVIPPGLACSDSLIVESDPTLRPNSNPLIVAAILNSFVSDALVRPHVQVMVTKVLLDDISGPGRLTQATRKFLAHASVRLHSTCDSYAALWREQLLGRQPGVAQEDEIPALLNDDQHWFVRTSVEAVVADLYGVGRSEYERILSCFSHRSYPKAPFLCLDAFDDLQEIGIEEFARKHDPYWEIDLNENLPKPAIDLPNLGKAGIAGLSLGPLFDLSSTDAVAEAKPTIRTSLLTAAPPTQHKGSATPFPIANGAFTTIAELIRSQGVITSSDAQQATGLDAAGVRPHLQQLVQQGLAVTEGQRRGMRYRRVDG